MLVCGNRLLCYIVLLCNYSNLKFHDCQCSDDILMAIRKLKILGNGFAAIPVGRSVLIQSVPGELTMDHTTVLQQAEVND